MRHRFSCCLGGNGSPARWCPQARNISTQPSPNCLFRHSSAEVPIYGPTYLPPAFGHHFLTSFLTRRLHFSSLDSLVCYQPHSLLIIIASLPRDTYIVSSTTFSTYYTLKRPCRYPSANQRTLISFRKRTRRSPSARSGQRNWNTFLYAFARLSLCLQSILPTKTSLRYSPSSILGRCTLV